MQPEDAEDVDEWEDDPVADELDEEEELAEKVAATKHQKMQDELEALWAQTSRAAVVEPTIEEVKLGRSAVQKVRHLAFCF